MQKEPKRQQNRLFDSVFRKTERSVEENFEFIDQVIWRGERRRDDNEWVNTEQRGSNDENNDGNERSDNG